VPRRTNTFQRLIAFIEAQLAPHGARVRESVLLDALDGTGPREVDVLIEGAIGDHPVRIAVECRDHLRRQPITWIEQLDGTYRSLPVDKVLAVSKSGFTKAAITRARLVGITTYTLKEALAADWPAEFTKWRAGLVVWTYHLTSAGIEYASDDVPKPIGDELASARVEGPDGANVSTLGEAALQLYHLHGEQAANDATGSKVGVWWNEGPGKEWEINVRFDVHNRFLVGSDGNRYPIKSIVLLLKGSFQLIAGEHSGVPKFV
jgi:hypothetical protein